MNTNINLDPKRALFVRLAFVSLVAVYFLIMVGGIVRSTGSGMGCPDWPRCFGQWVPPTSKEELPENYKEIYSEKRYQKNVKLARYLSFLGMDEKARQVTEEKLVYEEQDFNKNKTWTEYINRLVGATIGILLMATFFASVRLRKTDPVLFWSALAIVLVTGFQGWIGSLVVSTNLLPWMITAHMLISFIIVAGIIYMIYKADMNWQPIKDHNNVVRVALVISMLVLLVQVVFGTQVREGIDHVALSMHFGQRESWISQLDWQFYFHRSFSWVILAVHVILLWFLWKANERFWSSILFMVILVSFISGVLLVWLDVPPVLQPMHLLFACIAFGIQFYLFLIVKDKNNKVGKVYV